MEQEVKIESTSDGSHTLFVPSLNEHYHSVNGARQESNHIYINAGLQHSSKDDIKVLEIGFGTGLNAYLSLLDAEQANKVIDYTSVELYPLSMEIVMQLNYVEDGKAKEREYFNELHACEWNQRRKITASFFLTKVLIDFSKIRLPLNPNTTFDIIYYDAFAPEKQPDMWTQDIFNYLYAVTTKNGILITYCAKGTVRRMLIQAGYEVERLAGPPGKREILRATKR